MRVLVMGGTEFISLHLVRELLAGGHAGGLASTSGAADRASLEAKVQRLEEDFRAAAGKRADAGFLHGEQHVSCAHAFDPSQMRDFDRGHVTVQARWAENLICGFARLGGYPVGVVANQPRALAQASKRGEAASG